MDIGGCKKSKGELVAGKAGQEQLKRLRRLKPDLFLQNQKKLTYEKRLKQD